jgi:hypothetical protein
MAFGDGRGSDALPPEGLTLTAKTFNLPVL